MRAAGCDAGSVIQLVGEVEAVIRRGLPVVLVSDGREVMVVMAEDGDSLPEVVRTAGRFIPALAA